MVQSVFQMDKEESTQLDKMHSQIGQSGISAFNTAYLERYTELLAKSLKGKSDIQPAPRA
jgi:hypothetical protein